MRFILKMIFLAVIALAILPSVVPASYKQDAAADTGAAEAPSAMQLMVSAGQLIRDVGSLCDRQPELCETGKELAVYTGVKAREGFDIAYAMIQGDENQAGPVDRPVRQDATVKAIPVPVAAVRP